jgi:hypothetical protein
MEVQDELRWGKITKRNHVRYILNFDESKPHTRAYFYLLEEGAIKLEIVKGSGHDFRRLMYSYYNPNDLENSFKINQKKLRGYNAFLRNKEKIFPPQGLSLENLTLFYRLLDFTEERINERKKSSLIGHLIGPLPVFGNFVKCLLPTKTI